MADDETLSEIRRLAKIHDNSPAPPIQPNPNDEVLTPEETRAAFENLSRRYRPILRHNIDPDIPMNMQFAVVCFKLLPEPAKDIYGLVKVVGTYPTAELANERIKQLLSTANATVKYHIIYTGHWNVLSNSDRFSKETISVEDEDEAIHLQDEEASRARRKQENIMRDLREREEQLKRDDDDISADKDSIEYYTMQRYKFEQQNDTIAKEKKRLRENIEVNDKTYKLIKELNKKHPEYSGMWVDVLNEARKKIGLPPYVPDK